MIVLLPISFINAPQKVQVLPPGTEDTVINFGGVGITITNFGRHGAADTDKPSYLRPGTVDSLSNKPNYLFFGGLWIGAIIDGEKYVTQHEYGLGEWTPSPDNGPTGFAFIGPGESYFDVEARYQDFAGDPRNTGRHLGLKVIERTLSWPNPSFNSLFIYELGIIYDPSQSDIVSPPESLQIYLGWKYDADVCGASLSSSVDDLVYYDGPPEECDILSMDHKMGWEDTLTVLPDTTINIPDGIPDGFIVWGDDPIEKDITIAYYETHFGPGARPDSFMLVRPNRYDPSRMDTVYYYYLIPRNVSVMYDGDDPTSSEDDTGDNGLCKGWIGLALLYAPHSPDHKVATNGLFASSSCTSTPLAKSTGPNDTVRIIYPHAHQWWNMMHDPWPDSSFYNYLAGTHPLTSPYRFVPHPFDVDSGVHDYRFLLSSGPHWIKDINSGGDTLWFVFVGAVGEGLNGDTNYYWYGGSYKLGLRMLIERALVGYYSGTDGACDPAHPCSPVEASHWDLPVNEGAVSVETCTHPRYYTVDGRRVTRIEDRTIYFKVCGNKVSKFIKVR